MDNTIYHRYHDLVVFRDGDEHRKHYIEFFHELLRSYGQPRTAVICKMVSSVIRFFINSFLLMTCLSGYNETNLNRLLVNYDPDVGHILSDQHLYTVVKQFKNLYWAKSHLKHWNLFPRLHSILSQTVHNKTISMADIVACVIFLQINGIMQINPVLSLNTLNGNPFVIRDMICRYWFIKGLHIKPVKEYKFIQNDVFENRRKKYLSQCTNTELTVTEIP